MCLRSLERSGAEFSVDLIPPGRPYNALGVRQVADDFAAEGYITLGVDLYSEQVGISREENVALMMVANENMPSVIANLNAAVAYLKGRPDVTGKVGAMGWCFGGGIPSEQVLAFEAALTAAGIENDVDIYDAVGHGFWLRIDDDVDVRSAAGLDAWTRLKSFLDRNLRD